MTSPQGDSRRALSDPPPLLPSTITYFGGREFRVKSNVCSFRMIEKFTIKSQLCVGPNIF